MDWWGKLRGKTIRRIRFLSEKVSCLVLGKYAVLVALRMKTRSIISKNFRGRISISKWLIGNFLYILNILFSGQDKIKIVLSPLLFVSLANILNQYAILPRTMVRPLVWNDDYKKEYISGGIRYFALIRIYWFSITCNICDWRFFLRCENK